MTPFEKSSKCSRMDRYDRMAPAVGPGGVGHPAQDPEQQQQGESADSRHDLVARRARHQQAQSDERAAHQGQSEVAGQDRADLRLAVPEEDAHVDGGHPQHQEEQRKRAEELAENDLQVAQRRRQQQLDGARALFLRVGARGEERQDEQQDDRGVREERPDHELVDVDGLRSAPEHAGLRAELHHEGEAGDVEVAVQQSEQAHDHVGDRRDEVGAQFPVGDRKNVTHRRSP